MRPLQEKVAKQNAEKMEKKTELDTLLARKERVANELREIQEAIRSSREMVRIFLPSLRNSWKQNKTNCTKSHRFYHKMYGFGCHSFIYFIESESRCTS